MKPPAKHLKLVSLACHIPSEDDGDEIYIKQNGEKIWPADSKFHRLKANEEGKLDIKIDFGDKKNLKIELELWDFDWVSASDLLGKFEFDAIGEGNFSTDLMNSGGDSTRYTLHWEVRR